MLMRQALFLLISSAFMLIRKWSQNNSPVPFWRENESKKNLLSQLEKATSKSTPLKGNNTLIWLWLVFALSYTGFKMRILHLCTLLKGLFF